MAIDVTDQTKRSAAELKAAIPKVAKLWPGYGHWAKQEVYNWEQAIADGQVKSLADIENVFRAARALWL